MEAAKTLSVTLPPDLLVRAQACAEREHLTINEFLSEALRQYMTSDGQWSALLQRTRAKGKAMGVTSEADVERLSDEYRRDRHA